MKVLYLIVSLNYGGAERQFTELLKGVAAYDITPHVYYLEKSDSAFVQELEGAGIHPIHLSRKNKYDVSLIPRLVRIIREQKIEIVHSFMSMAGLTACLAGKVSGVPVVCSSIRNGNRPVLKNRMSLSIQATLSTIMVANSYAGMNNTPGSKHTKFRVVYNGINMNRFSVSREHSRQVRSDFGIDQFHQVVTMIAALSTNKDYDTYLEAAREVILKNKKTGFLVVGDGPEKARLQQKAVKLGIADHVIFTGYTSQIPEILSQTDISVLMSNPHFHLEGLPNVILESMAMSLPVIAGRGGGTNEVIRDGKNGFLVKAFDAKELSEKIQRLIHNPSLAKKMGESGRNMIDKTFSYSAFVKNYINIYKEILCEQQSKPVFA